MLKVFTQLLDWIYLKKCYFCGKSDENTIMCSSCFNDIDLLQTTPVFLDKIPLYSSTAYEKNIIKLVRGLKYHNKRDFGFFAAKIMKEYLPKDKIYTIIPVPMHKSREKARKYNHMDLIAEELGLLTGLKIKKDLIHRDKQTQPQYKLSRSQRQENLSGAFKVNKNNYNNENLLIIDDIFTTGATIKELIATLKSENINKITVLTLSKTA